MTIVKVVLELIRLLRYLVLEQGFDELYQSKKPKAITSLLLQRLWKNQMIVKKKYLYTY